MLKQIRKNSNLVFLILSVLLVIPAIISLLNQGFPLTDDGNWMVIRFSAFFEALRNGQFPVRFLTRLNNGYGYPVSDFLYPLFMYIGVPMHILGLSFTSTIKLIFGLSIIFSSIFSFLWLRKIFDNLSSFIGSLFYTLFPYQLFDIYQRGSVGETLSLSILPFILWQMERKSLLLVSLGISLLITAHNTLAFLFIPLILFYGYLRTKKISKFSILTLLFGFGISAFFWIPAILDTKYVVFGNTTVSNYASYYINNNLGLLGLISAFLVLEGIFYSIRSKDKFFATLLTAFLIISFFTLSFSEVFWKILPFTNLIQFPFRLISLLIPIGAFMIAFLLNKEKITKKYILIVIYLVLILVSSYPFLFPKSYQYFPESFYSTNQDTTTVRNEYMPKSVKVIPSQMYKSKVEVLNRKELPEILVQNANKTAFIVYLKKRAIIQINTIYFPGWEAYVNGIRHNIQYENSSGLIRLALNKGQNNVEIVFLETPVRLFSDFASIISILGLFIFHYFFKRNKFKL